MNVGVLIGDGPTKTDGQHAAVQHNICWHPPSEEEGFKINFAAAIKPGRGTGLGFVCRDFEGNILAAATKVFDYCLSPKLAEAVSMKWALQVARELSSCDFCMATDCLQLKLAWTRQKQGPHTYFEGLLEDCKLLSRNASHFQLHFVKRSGNKVADALANLAFDVPENIWIEEAPHQVASIILSDVQTCELNE
ncbi:hypothetical protein E2542_SST21303 [Spatholobus suberectus]|nr:hypothetical protein E2542_SST21303 [Spatholobus suberectus]